MKFGSRAAVWHTTQHWLRERGQRGEPIWERLDGEPIRAYEAFLVYLQTRSIKQVAERFGIRENNVRTWRAKYGWDIRTEFYLRNQHAESIARTLHLAVTAAPLAVRRMIDTLRSEDAEWRQWLECARDILRIAGVYQPQAMRVQVEQESSPKDALTELIQEIQQRAREHLAQQPVKDDV